MQQDVTLFLALLGLADAVVRQLVAQGQDTAGEHGDDSQRERLVAQFVAPQRQGAHDLTLSTSASSGAPRQLRPRMRGRR